MNKGTETGGMKTFTDRGENGCKRRRKTFLAVGRIGKERGRLGDQSHVGVTVIVGCSQSGNWGLAAFCEKGGSQWWGLTFFMLAILGYEKKP